MGSRGRDSPPGPGRDRPSPPGGAVGRGTRPGDGWGPIGVTGRRPRCECIRVGCPPRPKWAVVPCQAWGRVASAWPGRRRHRRLVERADPREHGPGGHRGEESRGGLHRARGLARVAVHCQGSDVAKRWPAHIFHLRSRTPPVLKWRNDAIFRARTRAGAPERYAPATFSAPPAHSGCPKACWGRGRSGRRPAGPALRDRTEDRDG